MATGSGDGGSICDDSENMQSEKHFKHNITV